ncbi:MAG: hypothetical protein EOO25_09890 [Comamonadaceae bacterium]|nr:MAG: hypothetical protein EOO25_09890 [Comamonadaceae bacterium]
MLEYTALALGLLVAGVIVWVVRRSIARERSRQAAPPPTSGLPPISPMDAQQVIDRAREAARAKARGGPDAHNPFAVKTRAHILWEIEYQRALLEWTPPPR